MVSNNGPSNRTITRDLKITVTVKNRTPLQILAAQLSDSSDSSQSPDSSQLSQSSELSKSSPIHLSSIKPSLSSNTDHVPKSNTSKPHVSRFPTPPSSPTRCNEPIFVNPRTLSEIEEEKLLKFAKKVIKNHRIR